MVVRFFRWLFSARPPSPDFPVPVCQILLLICGVFGMGLLISGGSHWWREQYFAAEGVLTDSGIVIAKWEESKEGGEGNDTKRFLRYRYADQSGRLHEHQVTSTSHQAQWEEFIAGSKLPPIEYLASNPRVHRYASEEGLGRLYFWIGLGMLAAMVPIRIVCGPEIWGEQSAESKKNSGQLACGTDSEAAAEPLERLPAVSFLLDYSSESFLAGDQRGIRRRFRLGDRTGVIFVGCVVIFFSISLAGTVAVGSNPANAQPPGSNLKIPGTICVIVCGLVFIGSQLQSQSERERLIKEGKVLKGTIIRSSGKITGNGEESWYSVRVDYRFLSPQLREIASHWERDREDLDPRSLPPQGTEVLVLYLDDTCYALL